MQKSPFGRIAAVCLSAAVLSYAATAAPKKKPAAKPKPKLGIKKTPQMAGAIGRFGELYAIKSGWTFEVLGARISYDAFDDYDHNIADTGKKLVVLRVAIKNNTPNDLYFNNSSHHFQIQDSNNQTYDAGFYRLKSMGQDGFGPTLKPGQGAGQDANNPLEVAIPVDEKAQVTKLILQQGRMSSKEDVMRFFIAGTQGGDPKNILTQPWFGDGSAPVKAGAYVPSSYYQIRIDKVAFVAGPIMGIEPPENRRFAVVSLTAKNATTKPVDLFSFMGNSMDKQYFTDADGEHYLASGDIGLLKGSADEQAASEFAAGQERPFRLVFPVPQTGDLKTLSFGSTGGKQWTYDASGLK